MGEMIVGGHPYPLRIARKCSSLSSSSFFSTFPRSAGLSSKSAVHAQTNHHVISLHPPSAACFPGSRDQYLGCLPKFNSLKISDVRRRNLRVAACNPLALGDGELRRSSTAEAVANSLKASSSISNARDGGISFNSRAERGVEGEGGGKRTQSMHVEPAIHPQLQLTSGQQDAGMVCVVLVGAFFWVRMFDFFTSKRIVEQKLSRKLVHITSGLLYMLCWPFFSTSKWAPFMAGLVPLANGIRLSVYGFELLKDEGLVKSMSRSGESRELLRGPLFYVMVLYFSTIFFWRESPVGMIALSMMCAGDGIADIMGRKFGSKKLPYNSNKSYAGSVAMFLFGFLVSSMCIYYFKLFGFFELDLYSTAIRLALISFLAAIVESLPITDQLDDNFTVPATSFILGILLFPSLS